MNARKQKSQAGTVLVEAAFTLLLLFTFLLGIIEAGHFLNEQEIVTNAAREGARMAVAPLTQTTTLLTPAQITTNVKTFLTASNVKCAAACVTVEPSVQFAPNPAPTFTRVTVQANYRLITMSMFSSINNLTLQGVAVMRNETSPY